MQFTNYHGHSEYCDGKEPVEAHVQKAIEYGISSLGISSHNPIPGETLWTMDPDEFTNYANDIQICRKKYQDKIELYLGLELDYLPGVLPSMSSLISQYGLDYAIGSVHYAAHYPDGKPWEIDGPHKPFKSGLNIIFNDNIREAVKIYYGRIREMLESDPPTIIGHLDKIKMQNSRANYFDENEPWYRAEVIKILDVIRRSGVIMEINTRGIYKKLTAEPYPSYWIIRQALNRGIPITVNSDAHRPEELINEFEEVYTELKSIGYNKVMVLKSGHWEAAEII